MYNSLNNNEKPYIILKNTKDIGSRISEIITIMFFKVNYFIITIFT